MDMSRDGVHSDKGITRFCEAATVFQTVFKPRLGKDISDCTYTYDVSNTERGSLCTPVTAENRAIAIQAANDAVKEPTKITVHDISGTKTVFYLYPVSITYKNK